MNKEIINIINKIRKDIIKMFDNKDFFDDDNDIQTIDNNLNEYFDKLIDDRRKQDIN